MTAYTSSSYREFIVLRRFLSAAAAAELGGGEREGEGLATVTPRRLVPSATFFFDSGFSGAGGGGGFSLVGGGFLAPPCEPRLPSVESTGEAASLRWCDRTGGLGGGAGGGLSAGSVHRLDWEGGCLSDGWCRRCRSAGVGGGM